MIVSPSQITNALACYRKWAFRTLWKLKDNKSPASRDFGTVMHACAERWLRADDQGRDRNTNQPVDPFPDGWEKVLEFGKDTGRFLSRMDQALVRVMFRQAIENGTLRRLPGRDIESYFKIPVIDGVEMQGFIDQDSEFVVEDHKSTKHKGYALSPKKLHDDPKMLCYAHVRKLRRNASLVKAPVTLRLNYFSKAQDKEPWPVEVNVSPDFIERFWQDTIIPTATKMLELKGSGLTIEQWAEVEGPNQKGACEDYGGCPYAEICSRITTVDRYIETQKRKSLPKEERKKGTMSFFKKRPLAVPTVKTEAVEPEQAPPAVVEQAPPAVVEQAPPAVVEQARDVPPWAVKGCNPCKGSGINSKGNPCGACDLVSGRTGGKTSSQFKVWLDDSGMLRWAPADGAEIVKPAPAKVEAKKATPKPKPEAKAETPPVAAPIQPEKKEEAKETPPTPAPAPAQVKLAAPSVGFGLFIGCTPLNRATMDLSGVLAREGAELAAAQGQDSYYQLDAFKRRDAIASKARDIAATLQGLAILAPSQGISPDERTLLVALQPLAEYVVVSRQ